MSLVQMSAADWVVLAGYLLLVLAIGAVAAMRIKSTDNYFLGSRGFGKLIMIAQSFGTGTHAEMPVSLAGAVYTNGLSGIWFQWKNLFVTPLYWLLAPLFRRFRRTTMSEVVEDRYGSWMGAFYTAFALWFFAANLAGMLKGAAKVINQTTGGHLPVNGIVVGMTGVFMLYGMIGGLVATAWTDVIQGFLIIALSFMVIPAGWHLVGGLAGMKSTLGAEKLSLMVPHDIGPWFILVLSVNGLVGIIAQPHLIAAVGTGKDEATCRIGQLYGNLTKRVCTAGWALVGLITAAAVARGSFGVASLADPEEAFGLACRHLLFPGGVGLLVASFLAANMAGCSAFMVDAGALVTNGFYRKYVSSGKSDRHYLRIGRISGLLVTASAVAYAVFLIKEVLNSFLFTETVATFVGVGILGGIFWRRANRWGALASLLVSLGANFGIHAAAGQAWDHWDPSLFAAALAAGGLALVTVSLLTPKEPAAVLDAFFANLDTSSDPREDLAVSESASPLLLVNLFHPLKAAGRQGFFRAYRTDLKGLGLGLLIIATLVFLFWLLVHSAAP